MDALRHDIRQAVRGLLRSKATSFAAFLTLALGLGITAALVSVVDGVLLRPLPYPASEQLVRVSEQHGTAVSPLGSNLSNLTLDAWDHAKTLDGLGDLQPRSVHLADGRRHRAADRRAGEPRTVRGAPGDACARAVLPRRGVAGGPERRRRPEPRPVAAAVRRSRRCPRDADAPRRRASSRSSVSPGPAWPSPATSRGCGRRSCGCRRRPPRSRSSPPSDG